MRFNVSIKGSMRMFVKIGHLLALVYSSSISINVLAQVRNDPPKQLKSPSIYGQPVVGNILGANAGAWTDTESELGQLSFDLQWMLANDAEGNNATPIEGATNAVYELPDSAVGAFICVRVTVSDDGTEQDFSCYVCQRAEG